MLISYKAVSSNITKLKGMADSAVAIAIAGPGSSDPPDPPDPPDSVDSASATITNGEG